MKNAVKIFIILFGFLSHDAFANVSKSSKIYIFHINGVNTNRNDALDNLNALKILSGISSNIIIWDLLYNTTHGLLASDLWVTLLQKKHEGKDLTIDDYVKTYMKTYDLHYPIGSEEYEELKSEIKDRYRKDPSFVGRNLDEIVDQFHEKIPAEFAEIKHLLVDYEETKNAYILLLPYSQGNLYANELWDYLVNGEHFPTDHIALFGIGNPADKIKGTVDVPPIIHGTPHPENQLRYITANNDFVINSLRIFSLFLPVTNTPMPGNVDIICYDKLCHSLIDAYLYDGNIKYLIADQINLFIIALKIKLIEEGLGKNINLLFDWPNHKENIDQLINNRGQIICTDGWCDESMISYVKHAYYYGHYDPYYYHYKWGFNEKLDANEYLILSNLNLHQPRRQFLIRGNIKTAIDNHYDQECKSYKSLDELRLEDNIKSPFFGIPKAELKSEFKNDCSMELPEIYFDGKFILGRFVIP